MSLLRQAASTLLAFGLLAVAFVPALLIPFVS